MSVPGFSLPRSPAFPLFVLVASQEETDDEELYT